MASIIKVNTIQDATNSNTAITIDTSGKVAIGGTSVTSGFKAELDQGGNTYALNIVEGSNSIRVGANGPEISATGDRLDLRTTDSNEMRFYTNNSERMSIDASGYVDIGSIGHSTTSMLDVASANMSSTAGGITVQNKTDNTGGYFVAFYRSNNALIGSVSQGSGSVAFNTTSDYRLKENVVTDWDATTRLKQLKPSRFNFKDYKDTTVDGFLAHEVSSIVPEAITGEKDAVDKDGNIQPQGIDQSKLVPLLVKTIQELEARIATLESK